MSPFGEKKKISQKKKQRTTTKFLGPRTMEWSEGGGGTGSI